MENSSKALIIAGSILVAILVIVVGNYIFNSSNSTIKTSIDDSSIDVVEQMYLSYEGIQMGTNVKQLLLKAAENNEEIYKHQTTIDICVCIRSNNKKLLDKVDGEFLRGLDGTRNYGVRYPDNIRQLIPYIEGKKQYKIEFNYNENTGKIWEIWINDID